MSVDKQEAESVREFRLEGVTLALVGGVLLAVIAGSFWAGRWYERRIHPTERAEIGIEDPLENVIDAPPPTDVGETANYFDQADAAGSQREPQREIAAATPPPTRAPEPVPAAAIESEAKKPVPQDAPAGGPAEGARGDWFVQVSAGRDRNAAEILIGQLQESGFPVRLFSDKTGGETLFRVRVGGYDAEADARKAEAELKQTGYRGAWVVHVE